MFRVHIYRGDSLLTVVRSDRCKTSFLFFVRVCEVLHALVRPSDVLIRFDFDCSYTIQNQKEGN